MLASRSTTGVIRPARARRAAYLASSRPARGSLGVARASDMSWLWTFGSVPELPPEEVHKISTSLAGLTEQQRADPATPRIIDVRTDTEFQGGHIQGAVNASFLPPWSFPDRVSQFVQGLPPDTPILVICLSAHRSIGALKWLNKQGYTNVKQLAGGMQAWRKEGLPESK